MTNLLLIEDRSIFDKDVTTTWRQYTAGHRRQSEIVGIAYNYCYSLLSGVTVAATICHWDASV